MCGETGDLLGEVKAIYCTYCNLGTDLPQVITAASKGGLTCDEGPMTFY
jgi:hypothetical protein